MTAKEYLHQAYRLDQKINSMFVSTVTEAATKAVDNAVKDAEADISAAKTRATDRADEAKAAGAAVVGTGRSDYPNQINNVLAFPGIFRGALDVRARDINDEMKVAAAYAIASLVSDSELNPEYIITKWGVGYYFAEA